MDRNDELNALRLLRERIRAHDRARAETEQTAEKLRKAESRKPTAVDAFDRAHKETYVISQIGRAPLRPRETVEVTVVDRTRKRFEKDFADYKKKYDRFSEAYYEDYAEQRRRLEEEERAQITEEVENSKQEYEEMLAREESAKQVLDADDTLGEDFKTLETVDVLIGYIQDRRADSVKEAMNLYFTEEHRRRLEELAKEQIRITEEAKKIAREAAVSAEKAAKSALKAAQRADESVAAAKSAMEKAEEALKRAEEAFEEADSVYIEALLKK